MFINLVDHRQKTVRPFALAPMNLVNADGVDRFKLAMGQAPLYEPFYRVVNGLPTGLERPGRFPPGHPSRPTSQETHHGRGRPPLALTPRNMLNSHPVLRAFHSSWRVKKVDDNPPQRHKEPAPFFQLVIARTRLLAGGTFATNSSMGLDLYLDPRRTARAPQANAVVYEANKVLYPVQEGLNFQLSGWFFVYHTRFNHESVNNGQPLFTQPATATS